MHLLTCVAAATLLTTPADATRQNAPARSDAFADVRRAFEAGRHERVVGAADADAAPEIVFLAAQSHLRAAEAGEARALHQRLAARPEDDPWHFVGVSGIALLDASLDAASAAAERAIELAPSLAEAHYEHGLVLARRQDWRRAAETFDRVAELDPAYAHAYYYGGLMHYQAKRTDLMAVRFERFLKLAPEAPERPEVLQIMRTLRGR